MDGKSDRRNNAAFSDSFRVVCTVAFKDTDNYNDALPGQCRSPLQMKTEVLLQERLFL